MTTENGGPDPYALVLADLKAKRAQIDQAIAVIEGLRGLGSATSAIPPSLVGGAAEAEELAAGSFLGMSIPDAAKKALQMRRKALGNAELAKILQEGGLVMNSADPMNTIGSVLTRRFKQVGDIVRVSRGTWGLKEWYPNRTFKTGGRTESTQEPTIDELLGGTHQSPSEAGELDPFNNREDRQL